jgi:hypothetical protein
LRYNQLISDLQLKYEQILNISSQKEFANEALKTKCSVALFSLRAESFFFKRLFSKVQLIL